MTKRFLAALAVTGAGLATATEGRGQCYIPTTLTVGVDVIVATTTSTARAAGGATLTNDAGHVCYTHTVSGTTTIIQDIPAVHYTEPFSGNGEYLGSLNVPAQLGSCYSSSLTGNGGGHTKTANAGPVCWQGPPPPPPEPCDTCPRDPCEIDPASCNNSPIVLRFENGPYEMTGLDDTVAFDINADGILDSVGWTSSNTPQGFLALDRNNNSVVDSGSELFGEFTPIPGGSTAENGFEALGALDSNRDGFVDAGDSDWRQLRLWIDANHNGISEAEELATLDSLDIRWLACDYKTENRRDKNGNVFRYKSRFGIGKFERNYYDVYLVTSH